MKKTLCDLGMYANLSIDMQLYMVAQQIKCFEPTRFDNVILRPGAMHIIMSSWGCIGTLMKGSGLDVLVSAAFGWSDGDYEWEGMRAFRIVTSSLLQHCLQCKW